MNTSEIQLELFKNQEIKYRDFQAKLLPTLDAQTVIGVRTPILRGLKHKEMLDLYDEMAKRESVEAKVYKAIDSLEALIQHNISDLSTWIPKEYELNKTYADDKVAFRNI